ncbi:hypothetical protein ABID16_003039 [Rhizobium aquaticum]|uniref:DUF155 domain-containing protein n=1 Tax=Rhizobium aquaticum TaxID=1549636 RepID=A0ABV2J1R7_9HYPH
MSTETPNRQQGNPEIRYVGDTVLPFSQLRSAFDGEVTLPLTHAGHFRPQSLADDLDGNRNDWKIYLFENETTVSASDIDLLTRHLSALHQTDFVLEVPTRMASVKLIGNSAIVYAASQSIPPTIAGVAAFWELKSQLAAIRGGIEAHLRVLDEVGDLVSPPTHKSLKRYAEMNDRYVAANRLRGKIVWVSSLVQLPQYIDGSLAKRIFGELVQQSAATTELDVYEQNVELIEDRLEIITERLIEFKRFRIEILAETAIAILIFADLLVSLLL